MENDDYGNVGAAEKPHRAFSNYRDISCDRFGFFRCFQMYVPRDNILGKVFVEYYPTPKLLD